MFQIKQSEATAARRRIPVLFVSSTDGFTPVTPTSPVAYISQNGATWVATTNTVAVATLAGGQATAGVYYLELTAAELANLGWITVNVQASNARQYNAHVQIMAYDPYDVVRIGLTSIPNVAQGNAGALPTGSATGQVTVATNNDKTGYSLTQAFPANFSSLAITAGGAVTAGTVSDKTGYSLSGTQTFNLTGSITGNLSGSVGSVTGAVGSVTGNVGGNVTGSVGSLTATAVQNIWDDATSSLTTVGSVGKLIVDNLNATVSSRSTLTDAQVWASATRTLTSGANIVLAKGTGITGFNDITANNVWSETLPGSYTSTQAGFKLNAAGSAADPWSTTLPGAYTSGTAGFIIGNNLNAAVGSVAGNVWTVGTRTLTAGTNIVLAKGTGITGFNDVSTNDIWTAGTRTLTAGTNIVLAKGTGITGFNDITALSVWDVLASTVSLANSIGLQLKTNIDATVSSRLASASYTAPLNTAGTAGAVWNALLASYGVADSFGQKVLRSASAQSTVSVTGSNHVAADIHELQPGVITNADFSADAIDANALAASAVSEIQSGLATSGGLTTVSNVTSKLDTTLQLDGAVYRFTANALELAPTGGGGGGGSSVTVRQGPFTMQSEQDTISGVVEALVGSDVPLQIQIGDGTGTPVPLSGTATINLKTYNSAGTLVETSAGTVDYAGLGYISATFTTTTTATAGRYTVVAEVTDGTLIKYGGLQLLVKGL